MKLTPQHDCPVLKFMGLRLPIGVTMTEFRWRCPVCGQRWRGYVRRGGQGEATRVGQSSWRWKRSARRATTTPRLD